MSHENHRPENELTKATGVNIDQCYQCGKCSAGCTMASDMDYPPSLVMRMLQTGTTVNKEKVLRSYSIWACVTCEQCIARCPMEIDIPKVMDYMREKSLNEKKTHPKAKEIIAFHKAFLDSIKHTGRLYEVGLIVDYKLRTLNMTQDVTLAPKMFAKGKLHLLPEMVKNRKHMASIFAKTIEKKEEVAV